VYDIIFVLSVKFSFTFVVSLQGLGELDIVFDDDIVITSCSRLSKFLQHHCFQAPRCPRQNLYLWFHQVSLPPTKILPPSRKYSRIRLVPLVDLKLPMYLTIFATYESLAMIV